MTNKEAIEQLSGILAEAIEFENSVCYVTEEDREPLEMAIEALENQKTGYWIELNVNKDGTHNIYCSNCNKCQKFKGHANSYNARTKLKYCFNCGAKMEGE